MTATLKTYRLRFSMRTDKTTVHSDTCSSAAFLRSSVGDGGLQAGMHASGDSVWQVRAESAQAAAAAQDAEHKADERSLPKATVCGCAL